MSTECTFDLSSTNSFYYSGETVNGSIILQLPEEQYVKDIHLILRGKAKVFWEEEKEKTRRDGTTYTETVEYTANEVYVDIRKELAGQGNIGPGELTYPFSIELPESCRSSFGGSYGSIDYNLTLVVERGTWAKQTFHKKIYVVKVYDLNAGAISRIPLQAEETKSFCCSSGTLSYTLNIPYGGYVSNQILKYSLHIHNQSLSDTAGYTVEIMQNIFYTARAPHHSENGESLEKYHKSYDDKCLRLSTRIFKGEVIIPYLVPTIDGDGIIRVIYEMIVTVHFKGCTADTVMRVPLRIGTIALSESLTAVDPTAPFLPLSDDGDPPNYQYFKPPSFDEATVSSAPPEEAPPYESIVENSQRPIMGFRILNEKTPENI